MTNIEIRLRRVVPDDLEFAHDLTRANMKDLVDRHYGGWKSDIFRKGFGTTEEYIVYANSDRVGFVSYTLEENRLFLRNIQILSDRQNQGIGTRVMNEIECIAKEVGCNAIFLAVFPDNSAFRFYERLGYKQTGTHKMLLMLEKPLAEPGAVGKAREKGPRR